jgi:hypothetical protein
MLSFGLFSRPARKKPPPIREFEASELQGDALIEAIIAEIHETAVRIAGVGSWLNALVRYSDARRSLSYRSHIPEEPTLLAVARLFVAGDDLDAVAATNLIFLFGKLRVARRQLDALVADNGQAKAAHVWQIELKECQDTWRAMAVLALDIVNELEPETRWRLDERYSDNSLVLARLLRQVSSGKSPCVDDMGNILLAELPQRRRAPRFSLQQNCSLGFRGIKYRAFTRDISIQGVGLTGCPHLRLRERAEVELRNGRRLSGIVIWSKDGRVGIKFDQHLPWNDPLIR